MEPFEAGIIDGMEKTAGALTKKLVRGFVSTVRNPKGFVDAVKRTNWKGKLKHQLKRIR